MRTSHPSRWIARSAVFALLTLLTPLAAHADDATTPASTAPANSAAMAAYRVDMLTWINQAQSELEQLAAAMPEDKYSWRPGKGVRSVGEVYLHVAQANYGLPGFAGVTPPAGFKFDGYDTSMQKKADVQKALHDSFEHVKNAFGAASEADLDKPVDLFGTKSTARGVYMLLLSHAHEHLGQSIAYARMNGVVPPWTAKQQEALKKMSEKPAAEKK
jgi:uncharacterized damage-inducible protein DinB